MHQDKDTQENRQTKVQPYKQEYKSICIKIKIHKKIDKQRFNLTNKNTSPKESKDKDTQENRQTKVQPYKQKCKSIGIKIKIHKKTDIKGATLQIRIQIQILNIQLSITQINNCQTI